MFIYLFYSLLGCLRSVLPHLLVSLTNYCPKNVFKSIHMLFWSFNTIRYWGTKNLPKYKELKISNCTGKFPEISGKFPEISGNFPLILNFRKFATPIEETIQCTYVLRILVQYLYFISIIASADWFSVQYHSQNHSTVFNNFLLISDPIKKW